MCCDDAVVEAVPEVRYARSGTVNIAYTRWGQGSHVVVYTPPLVSNVELYWESPEWARVLRHGGEHSQCVMIDKRGVGLSDRVTEPPSLSDRVADTLAVMAAEDLARVDLIGHSEGGAIAVAFAAEHPERVRSMVLIDSTLYGVPRGTCPSSPMTITPIRRSWSSRRWGGALCGTGVRPTRSISICTRRASRLIRAFVAGINASSVSRRALGRSWSFFRSVVDYDLRPLLARVHTPTLVTHSRGDRVVHVAHGRYLATAIAGARYIEYGIDDHIWQLAPQWRQIQDDIIEFVTGHRPSRLCRPRSPR